MAIKNNSFVVCKLDYTILGNFKTENKAKKYAHFLSKKNLDIFRYGSKEKIEKFKIEDENHFHKRLTTL